MRQNRTFETIRPISFEIGVNIHAEGSCLAKLGNTHVLCTASIEEKIPPWLKNSGRGGVTAEYGMTPRSTNIRIDREAVRGKQVGRTQEIQRLIGRSLRSVVNLEDLGERQIKIDCDVLQADGGTRTTAISGGFVALYQAINLLKRNYNIQKPIIKEFVAAISAGIIEDNPNLDLNYDEDSKAQVDANFVICESGKLAEIQITGEEYFFSEDQYNALLSIAKKGIKEIIKKQKEVLNKL